MMARDLIERDMTPTHMERGGRKAHSSATPTEPAETAGS
jgi:hypothetical protein